MRRVALGVISFIVACSSSDDVDVDRRRCEKLRDHMVELRLHDVKSGIDVRAHKEAMKRALGERFVTGCMKELSPSELQCHLRARDLATATACSKRATK